MDIKRGSHITARHIKSGKLLHYRVVVERETGLFRLISLSSFYIACGLKTKNPKNVIDYIEKRLKCEVIKVSI
ncbi:hypothetical protein COJ01_18110 [Priestia megaterium]|nr:hypothetical protein COJ01_18110 [Priestia megaterium]